MLPESFERYVSSPSAVPVHAVFLSAIVALTYAIGSRTMPENVYLAPALALSFAGYLLTLWFMSRRAKPKLSPRDTVRQRIVSRLITLVFLWGIAFLAIHAGFNGWTIRRLPAHYLGFILFALAAAGTCGANLWYGGPLDMRDDGRAAADEAIW